MKRLQTAGFIFTVVLGGLLHFAYPWSGENPIVGAFSAVNESTWEHLKLIITPMLLFGIFEYFAYGKRHKNFVPVKFLSILLGMATILILFYTYSGITGHHYPWLDIIIFVLGTLIAYRFSYKLLQTDRLSSNGAVLLGTIGLVLLIACVIVFTYHPPEIPLFIDHAG
ncbi:MAG: hypothetical protein EOM54_01840 [Clostridia bacterium]|nr:hypothetical protein [Clostridia bacterium]